MLKKIFLFVFLGMGLSASHSVFSQNPLEAIHDTINKDDLGEVADEFHNLFFQALSYRGIENYQRAIDELHKAEDMKVDEPAVYFELGKNYASLEEYRQAENYFLKILKNQKDDTAVLGELENLYRQSEQYSKAIPIAEKLVLKDNSFRRELAELYYKDKQFDKSLENLELLKNEKEQKVFADSLHQQIIENVDFSSKSMENYLLKKIKEQPQNSSAYQDLIYRYQASGQIQEARKIAGYLEEFDSENPYVSLVFYEKYIEGNKPDEAIEAMKIVISSPLINSQLRKKTLEDLDKYVEENPTYQNQLAEVLDEADENTAQSPKELGDYYLERDADKALIYFEKALKESPQDYKLIVQVLDLQVRKGKFEEAQNLAEEKIDYFPTQAILYLYKAKAENKLQEFEQAQKSLMNGIDFVIENDKMQADFYQQLSEAYKGLGQMDKANEYEIKAAKLNEQ